MVSEKIKSCIVLLAFSPSLLAALLEARARLLKMLCAGYDVGLTVGESRDNGLEKVVVMDYGKFSW